MVGKLAIRLNAVDRERLGAEPGMRGEISRELVERRVVQPRQGDVRSEFARLGRQPGADQRLLDLVAQGGELGTALDPDPQIARLVPPPKTPVPASCKANRRARSRDQRIVDIGRDILADFADEPQGQVEIAGVDPSRPGTPEHSSESRSLSSGGKPMPTNSRSMPVT